MKIPKIYLRKVFKYLLFNIYPNETHEKAKKPIPKPDKKSTLSGKLIIRIDPNLHERLALESLANNMSLNKYIEQKLARS